MFTSRAEFRTLLRQDNADLRLTEMSYRLGLASQERMAKTLLKKNGVETSLVIYSDEGHGWRPNLKPWNRADLLNRMINWFASH